MTRILIPPGIGDAYWVLVKLQSFLDQNGLQTPEITVVCNPDQYGSENRSIPFLKRIPFIKVGEPQSIPNDPDLYNDYLEAYSKRGRTIWPNFQGYDYFISYNGQLNSGSWIELSDTHLKCNWYPDMTFSQEECDTRSEYESKYGKYVVFYWPMFGSFENHLSLFSREDIRKGICKFLENNSLIPVFVGSLPDISINKKLPHLIDYIPNAINVVGKTTLDQTLGIVKGAELVVGYHSGLTNMAVVFQKKTVLLWGDMLPPTIAWSCFPPDTRNTNYKPLFCKNLTVKTFVNQMESML